jgi:hypothetical protein
MSRNLYCRLNSKFPLPGNMIPTSTLVKLATVDVGTTRTRLNNIKGIEGLLLKLLKDRRKSAQGFFNRRHVG